MNNEDKSQELIDVIVWALDCILRDDYRETFDPNGKLESLELRPGLSKDAVTIDFLEKYFRKVLAHDQSEALFSLRDQRTPENIEKALGMLFPPEIASRGAEELSEADWSEIVLFVDAQLAVKREIGKAVGELVVKEREGFSTPYARDVEVTIKERQPDYLLLFTARKYAGEFQRLLPKIFKRAQILQLLPTVKAIPEYVRRYFLEASRCYLYGQFLASLLLCRSALEEAVQDRLRKDGHEKDLAPIKKTNWLYTILQLAHEKHILDDSTYREADAIRELANDAIHGNKRLPSDEQSIHAYKQTRYILQSLYQ